MAALWPAGVMSMAAMAKFAVMFGSLARLADRLPGARSRRLMVLAEDRVGIGTVVVD